MNDNEMEYIGFFVSTGATPMSWLPLTCCFSHRCISVLLSRLVQGLAGSLGRECKWLLDVEKKDECLMFERSFYNGKRLKGAKNTAE